MSDEKHGSNAFTIGRKRNRIRGPHKVPFKKRRMGQMASGKATRALSLVGKLMRAREVKIHDIGVTSSSVLATGIVYALGDISQGDTGLLRDGNSCNIFSVDVRWEVVMHATDVHSAFRIIIFRDRRQVKGTAPITTTVLTTASPFSQFEISNRTRFDVWYDFSAFVNTAAPGVQGHFHKKVNVKQLYYGSAATNLLANGIYMLILTNEVTNAPTFTRSSRTLFNDY